MTVAELIKGLAEYPPDALVVFRDGAIIGPVSSLEARDIAQVDGLGCYPANSLVLKALVEYAQMPAVYLPAAVIVL